MTATASPPSATAELRDYYGIDTGDQEMRIDNKSYASLVPEEGGEAQLVEDLDALETPDADTRTDETHERLRDPGRAEIRQVTAEDVTHDTQESDEGEAGRDPGEDEDDDREADEDEDEDTDEDDGKQKEKDRDSDR